MKRLLIGTVTVLTVTMIGIASAATHSDPQIPVKTAKVASTANKTTQTLPVTTEATPVQSTQPALKTQTIQQTEPVQQQSPSQADQNRSELQSIVTSKAQSYIPLLMRTGVTQQQIDDAIAMQWTCADKLITNTVGYDDYDTAYNTPSIQLFVNSPHADGTYAIFSDLSCHMQNRLPQN